MGDGSKNGTGLILNTQCFSIKECVQIIGILNYKYGLICNIFMQRNFPIIYITGKSMRNLKPHIFPYMIPSMHYKLHN